MAQKKSCAGYEGRLNGYSTIAGFSLRLREKAWRATSQPPVIDCLVKYQVKGITALNLHFQLDAGRSLMHSQVTSTTIGSPTSQECRSLPVNPSQSRAIVPNRKTALLHVDGKVFDSAGTTFLTPSTLSQLARQTKSPKAAGHSGNPGQAIIATSAETCRAGPSLRSVPALGNLRKV